jgi:malonyl-CoA O-methyltransferase
MIDIHKQKIKSCFNKAFSSYDQYSEVQQCAGKKLIKSIEQYKKNNMNTIIDLGCGTGIITEQLARKMEYQQFFALDISDKLLLKAKEKLKNYNIKIIETDLEDFYVPYILFDLVFSNMALQWSLNLSHTLLNINKNLNAHGMIAFSLPIENTFIELQPYSYNKNKFYAEKEILQLLSKTGFKKITYFSEKSILTFDSLRHALRYIKYIGANYVFNAEQTNQSSKYFYRSQNKYSLTYQIGFYMAEKA